MFSFYPLCSHFVRFVLISSALLSFCPLCSHFIRFVPILSALFSFYPLCSHFIRFVPILSALLSLYPLCSHFIRFVIILSALFLFYPLWSHLSALLSFCPLCSYFIRFDPILSAFLIIRFVPILIYRFVLIFFHFILILSALFSFYPLCYHFIRFLLILSSLLSFYSLSSHFIRFDPILSAFLIIHFVPILIYRCVLIFIQLLNLFVFSHFNWFVPAMSQAGPTRCPTAAWITPPPPSKSCAGPASTGVSSKGLHFRWLGKHRVDRLPWTLPQIKADKKGKKAFCKLHCIGWVVGHLNHLCWTAWNQIVWWVNQLTLTPLSTSKDPLKITSRATEQQYEYCSMKT